MPSRTFHARASTRATTDTAWAALQRPGIWEGIAGVDEVTDARHGPDGLLTGFAVRATVGGTAYPGTAVVTASRAPTAMRVDVTTEGLAADIDVTLRTTDAETSVSVSITVTSRGFLGGLVFPVVAEAIGSGLDRTVADFAARLAD